MQNVSPSDGARLSDYFGLLRRRWLAVLIGLGVGLAGAFAYLHWAPKEYKADALVLVNPTPADTSPAAGATRNAAINLDTEAQLVTGSATENAVAQALHLPANRAASLSDNVTVTVPPNTGILDITYVADSAAEAQQGSLAFANAYLAQRQAAAQAYLQGQDKALQAQIDGLNGQLAPLNQQVATLSPTSGERARVDQQINTLNDQLASLIGQQREVRTTTVDPGRIIKQPTQPANPSSPDELITLAAGAVIGLLLGVGLAALRHRADDRIRTPRDLVRKTPVPLAAALSTRVSGTDVALLPALEGDGRNVARLRNLVTRALEDDGRKAVLVAGVRRGGGPVAANLAASLARAGEEVYLLCADVFATTANSLVPGAAAHAGLAEVLAGDLDATSAAQAVPGVPHLRVLGPGRDPDRADALLQTRGTRQLVDDLLAAGAYVVVEAPGTIDSTDAQTLAQAAAVAIVVGGAGPTTARDVVDACEQFESMHTPVLGAVFVRYGRDHRPGHLASSSELTGATASARPARAETIGDQPGRQPTDALAGVESGNAPTQGTVRPEDAELVRAQLRGRPRS